MSIGRSSLGVFGTNLLNLVLSIGNSIFLTRTLGVEGRGEFAVFSASIGILSLVLGLGLDVSLRYYVARDQVPRDRILSSLVLYALATGALLLGAVHLNHALFDNEIFLPAGKQGLGFEVTLVGVVVVNMVYANVSSVFAGTRAFRPLNVATIAFAGVSMAAYAALLWAKSSSTWAVSTGDVFVAYLGLQASYAVAMVFLAARRLGVRLSPRLLDGELVRAMLTYAGLAWISNLAQFLNYRVDIWIVQYFAGSTALGLYSLAASLAGMLWLLPRALSTVLLPATAAGDEGAGLAETARLGRLALAGTVAVAIPMGLLAPWWITLMYGDAFTAAAKPLVLLLLGSAPFSLCVVQAGVLAGMNRQKVNLGASVAGLVVTVVLDILLIPPYGIAGAAVASSASYLVTTVVVLRSFARLGSMSSLKCTVVQRGDLLYVRDGLKSLLR